MAIGRISRIWYVGLSFKYLSWYAATTAKPMTQAALPGLKSGVTTVPVRRVSIFVSDRGRGGRQAKPVTEAGRGN